MPAATREATKNTTMEAISFFDQMQLHHDAAIRAAYIELWTADSLNELDAVTRSILATFGLADDGTNTSPLVREFSRVQTAKRTVPECGTDKQHAAAKSAFTKAQTERREKAPAMIRQIADLQQKLDELDAAEKAAQAKVNGMESARCRLANLAPRPLLDDVQRAKNRIKEQLGRELDKHETRLREIDGVLALYHWEESAVNHGKVHGLPIVPNKSYGLDGAVEIPPGTEWANAILKKRGSTEEWVHGSLAAERPTYLNHFHNAVEKAAWVAYQTKLLDERMEVEELHDLQKAEVEAALAEVGKESERFYLDLLG